MKPIVCIGMEIKIRELNSLLFLALHFVQQGFPVLFGHRSRVWRFFRKDAGDMPIFYLAKENTNIEELKTSEMKVFFLDEEGGGAYLQNGKTRVGSVPIQHHLEKIFVWGDRFGEYMIKHGANPSKIMVTGHPKFELAKLQDLSQAVEKLNAVPRPRKYILVNSNWATLHYVAGLEKLRILHRSMGLDIGLERPIAEDKKVLGRMIPLIKKIAAKHKDVTVVVRPHPIEDPKHYDAYFDEPNILVTKEGTSQFWVAGALAVIHCGCTTGIEAFFARKNLIAYLGDETEHRDSIPIQISSIVETEEDALRLVDESISRQGEPILSAEEIKKREDLLRPCIGNVEYNACERISTVLTQAAIDYQGQTYVMPQPKSWVYRTAKKIRKIIKQNNLNTGDLIVKNKFPSLSQKEVESAIKLFRHVKPSLPDVTVTEYDVDTFLLTPRT